MTFDVKLEVGFPFPFYWSFAYGPNGQSIIIYVWEKRVAELSGFYPKFLDYARLDFFSRMALGFLNLGK